MSHDFAPAYIFRRAAFRVVGFFKDWYIGGTRYFLSRFTLKLHNLDKTFAVRVNLHHLFEPLYRDYSLVGKIIGPPVRMLRVFVGGVAYLFVALFFAAVYILWILALPAVVAYAIFPAK